MIAVDLPGFGESAALPDGPRYGLATVVPAPGGLCAAPGVEWPHAAGNPPGGPLAPEPGRKGLVRSVTALSPAGFRTEGERRRAFGRGGRCGPAPGRRRHR
ncbi:hypothetical protein [Streptomyces roseolilacinus]|uniref:hypothetical protein n=1 Tax=Streptomyces roseolilacinus TaxID=66904 RepID=UPI0038077CCF